MSKILNFIKDGQINLLGKSMAWQMGKAATHSAPFDAMKFERPYCLHLGPGPNWVKPNKQWVNVDVDPQWGDLVLDFKDFSGIPLKTNSTECIYGSHVFEHMSIWITNALFAECLRILKPGGHLRLVLPDAEKSIREYVEGNADFPLFKRRRERAKELYGLDYTLFDCLREDFLSRSGQAGLLGARALAHQNAWDFESIRGNLLNAGFSEIHRSSLSQSRCPLFSFEGSYECEALEDDRSLYVDAVK